MFSTMSPVAMRVIRATACLVLVVAGIAIFGGVEFPRGVDSAHMPGATAAVMPGVSGHVSVDVRLAEVASFGRATLRVLTTVLTTVLGEGPLDVIVEWMRQLAVHREAHAVHRLPGTVTPAP